LETKESRRGGMTVFRTSARQIEDQDEGMIADFMDRHQIGAQPLAKSGKIFIKFIQV
jgi:hypothetical protein